MYYTVFTGKYHESVAVLSRVLRAQVTIRLQTSDVSQYTLYNTFIMFPHHWNASTLILRYYLVTGHCGLATIALTISVLTVQPRSQAVWDLRTMQPEMADHDLLCSWRRGPLVIL